MSKLIKKVTGLFDGGEDPALAPLPPPVTAPAETQVPTKPAEVDGPSTTTTAGGVAPLTAGGASAALTAAGITKLGPKARDDDDDSLGGSAKPRKKASASRALLG